MRAFGHQWRRERTRAKPKGVGLKGWARKETVVREGKRYKYLPGSQRSDKSWQCCVLPVAMPLYDIDAPQVEHCYTKPDSRDKRVLSKLSWLNF